MNSKQEYLIKHYQEFMEPHEQMVARWLTEDWDRESSKLPSWLHTRVWQSFTSKTLSDPNALARVLCLKLLKYHKHEMHLPK